jgi:hypothetical protein
MKPALFLPMVASLASGRSQVGNGDMNPQSVSSTQEVLAGLVERVTYHNAENGFCVCAPKRAAIVML